MTRNCEHFELGEFVTKQLIYQWKCKLVAVQGMDAVHQRRQMGQNCAKIVQIVGRLVKVNVQSGQQRLNSAKEIQGVRVKMA